MIINRINYVSPLFLFQNTKHYWSGISYEVRTLLITTYFERYFVKGGSVIRNVSQSIRFSYVSALNLIEKRLNEWNLSVQMMTCGQWRSQGVALQAKATPKILLLKYFGWIVNYYYYWTTLRINKFITSFRY